MPAGIRAREDRTDVRDEHRRSCIRPSATPCRDARRASRNDFARAPNVTQVLLHVVRLPIAVALHAQRRLIGMLLTSGENLVYECRAGHGARSIPPGCHGVLSAHDEVARSRSVACFRRCVIVVGQRQRRLRLIPVGQRHDGSAGPCPRTDKKIPATDADPNKSVDPPPRADRSHFPYTPYRSAIRFGRSADKRRPIFHERERRSGDAEKTFTSRSRATRRRRRRAMEHRRRNSTRPRSASATRLRRSPRSRTASRSAYGISGRREHEVHLCGLCESHLLLRPRRLRGRSTVIN